MLHLIERSYSSPKHVYNLYLCSYCGEEEVRRHRNPQQRSCGCMKGRETHGHEKGRKKSPELGVYQKMKDRCYNPNNKDFHNYGGRGIFICDRWLDSFEDFLEDMAPRPKGLELDRTDNDGPYSPENCTWVTSKENCRNTRKNRNITYEGKTQCLTAWREEFKIPKTTFYRLSRRGRSDQEIIHQYAGGSSE